MDPYQVLNIRRDADAETIRKAYRAAAKRTHPDATGRDTAREFEEVRAAYEVALRQLRASSTEPLPAWAEELLAAAGRGRAAFRRMDFGTASLEFLGVAAEVESRVRKGRSALRNFFRRLQQLQ